MEKPSLKIAFKILLDFILLGILETIALVIDIYGEPFERGFFCNDESLLNPFKNGRSFFVLSFTSSSIAILTIIIVESIRANRNADESDKRTMIIFNRNIPLLVQKLYHYIGILLFVMSTNQFLTDLIKRAIGRFRPHFIDVCRPLMPNGTTCKDEINHHRYIQEFTCSNEATTDDMLKNMRLSFPSGHSSFIFAVTVYMIIYIQARITWRGSKLLKHFLQVMIFAIATIEALSRISDYKHHWTDVFGGFILGSGIAIAFASSATDLFQQKNQQMVKITKRECNCGINTHQI